MNNESPLQSSSWARAFLVLAWLLPCLGILANGAVGGMASLPPGVGYLESERTLLTALCFLGFLFSGSRFLPSSISGRLCLAFLVWSGLSCLSNESPFDSFLFWQVWLAPVFFFGGARRFGKQLQTGRVRAALIHIPVALIASVALLPIFSEPVFLQIGGVFELAGVLANWLLFLLPLSLYDALEGRGAEAWTASAAACLSFVVIAFSFSRAGWILACLEAFFVLFVLASVERRRLALITLWITTGIVCLVAFRQSFSTSMWAGAFIAIPLLPLLLEIVASRVKVRHGLKLVGLLLVAGLLGFGLSTSESMQTAGQMTDSRIRKLKNFDNSSRARVELWKAAALMARAHPLLGVGPGDFSVHYPQFQQHFYYYSDSAHCAALEMAAEVGFVGLGLFLAMLMALLWEGVTLPLSPFRRNVLLGLTFGLGYAQIDLAYQFGHLWLTVAVLFLFLLPPSDGQDPPVRVRGVQVGIGLISFALVCYLLPPLRQVEMAKSLQDTSLALQATQGALRRLPFWRQALVRSYQYQVQLEGPMPSSTETERLLSRGSSLASVHAAVGERYLKQNELEKAADEYQKALRLDPHNYPFYYGQLRKIGLQLSDAQLVQTAEKTVLEKYSPEKISMAHLGHRTVLQAQLHPVLLDIADSANPYRQPLKTLPIYRYLYDFKPTPRAAYGLGISLQTLGRTQEATPYLEEARRRFSTSPK